MFRVFTMVIFIKQNLTSNEFRYFNLHINLLFFPLYQTFSGMPLNPDNSNFLKVFEKFSRLKLVNFFFWKLRLVVFNFGQIQDFSEFKLV